MHMTRLIVMGVGVWLGASDVPEKVERKTLVIRPAPAKVTIDGRLDEWAKGTPAQIVLDPEEKDIFSAKAWAMWDGRHLYVAFDVADNSPMRNSGDDPVLAFKTGDTVEFFLGTDPTSDPKRAEPTPTDYRVAMTYLRNTKPTVTGYHPVSARGPARYYAHPTGGWRTRLDEAGPIPDAVFRVHRRPDGKDYTAEASVPWTYFGRFQPRAGLRLPFDLAVNFSDAAGRMNVAKVHWNGSNFVCTDIATELRLNPWAWGWAMLQGPTRERK